MEDTKNNIGFLVLQSVSAGVLAKLADFIYLICFETTPSTPSTQVAQSDKKNVTMRRHMIHAMDG